MAITFHTTPEVYVCKMSICGDPWFEKVYDNVKRTYTVHHTVIDDLRDGNG